MAITFGFYNSVNHDRRYNSEQISRIFDGVIGDGVYETIGDKFKVSAFEGQEIIVGSGRAWFHHTWTLNDSDYVINCGPSEILLDRIDAVVLEINANDSVRVNSIKVVNGTPSSSPVKPTLSNNNKLYQIPFAYIYRKAGVDIIETADITNAVGTSECPFVIGIIKTMNIDMFIEQWGAQWDRWITDKKEEIDDDWESWSYNKRSEFTTWFNSLDILLQGDVATNLANEIVRLNGVIDTLMRERVIYSSLDDNDDDPILDNFGNVIEGTVKFSTDPCLCRK